MLGSASSGGEGRARSGVGGEGRESPEEASSKGARRIHLAAHGGQFRGAPALGSLALGRALPASLEGAGDRSHAMKRLRLCLVTAEIAPFAKTGGLADVAAALARLFDERGYDVRVFTPLYPQVSAVAELTPVPRLQDVGLTMGPRALWFSVSTALLPRSRVRVHFVRCPNLYARPTIYTEDPDEHLRFALLQRAALESCQWLQWSPDVVHCHDWHTGLVPLYLRTVYAWDRLFERTRTVLTIHNLPHQGVFPASVVDELGLANERRFLHQEDLAANRVSFLKTGLLYADELTTVSETYAREIQTPEQGAGLDPILRARADHLHGILNGVDYAEWDPATDPLIPQRYSSADLAGKAACKRALMERMGLAPGERAPLFGVVSRLWQQKGPELIAGAFRGDLLRHGDLRLAVLGSGDRRYEDMFTRLVAEFPGKVAFHRGFDNSLAHQIEAGSDLFLMPSLYEPAGLNQMYSLKYGTIPIVRRTGGLADTVRQYDPASGEGTGFLFDDFRPEALLGAVRHALEIHGDPKAWTRLVRNAMAEDFSWGRSVERYAALFEGLAS